MHSIAHTFHFVISCLLLLLCNIVYAEDEARQISRAEMDSLAMKFYSWEKGNENDSLLRLQLDSITLSRAIESYSQTHEYSILQDNNQTDIDKILIVVKENVYSAIPSYILRYAHDIHNTFGCAIDIYSVSGETASQIRNLLQNNSNNLDGAVLIGDIIHANFYHPDSIVRGDTIWKHETFPCDLYYMDLDGFWTLKTGHTDTYDIHSGKVMPEIFVGRINTATMGRSEIAELKAYFDKNHQYWTGKKQLNKKKALTFTGPDWDGFFQEFRTAVSPLYGDSNYVAFYGNSYFTKANYCTSLQNSNYEFIQLACHSNFRIHNFKTTADSILSSGEISVLNTLQIGYNLFCCKACNWVTRSSSPCLGEGYLYGQNSNSSALAVIGSTKTGSMLGFEEFYTPLGMGKCIGQSFKDWWINHLGNTHDGYTVHWHYGMVILGDPLINFNYSNECDNIMTLNGGEEITNRMYYAQNQIKVQNYSITQGQHVTLSAPTIQITGPFVCNSSSLIAGPFDSCICNARSIDNYNTEEKIRQNTLNKKKISSNFFYVFPNPVHDILIVCANKQLTNIAIFNLKGECMICTTQMEINVSQLPTGIYILRTITAEGKVYQTKFIKQ